MKNEFVMDEYYIVPLMSSPCYKCGKLSTSYYTTGMRYDYYCVDHEPTNLLGDMSPCKYGDACYRSTCRYAHAGGVSRHGLKKNE